MVSCELRLGLLNELAFRSAHGQCLSRSARTHTLPKGEKANWPESGKSYFRRLFPLLICQNARFAEVGRKLRALQPACLPPSVSIYPAQPLASFIFCSTSFDSLPQHIYTLVATTTNNKNLTLDSTLSSTLSPVPPTLPRSLATNRSLPNLSILPRTASDQRHQRFCAHRYRRKHVGSRTNRNGQVAHHTKHTPSSMRSTRSRKAISHLPPRKGREGFRSWFQGSWLPNGQPTVQSSRPRHILDPHRCLFRFRSRTRPGP